MKYAKKQKVGTVTSYTNSRPQEQNYGPATSYYLPDDGGYTARYCVVLTFSLVTYIKYAPCEKPHTPCLACICAVMVMAAIVGLEIPKEFRQFIKQA